MDADKGIYQDKNAAFEIERIFIGDKTLKELLVELHKNIHSSFINDGYDSGSPCADIGPFKNVIRCMPVILVKKLEAPFKPKCREALILEILFHYEYDVVKTLEKREKEPDHIIERLFEDKTGGKLDGDRFYRLLSKYEVEQKISAQLSLSVKSAKAEQENGQ